IELAFGSSLTATFSTLLRNQALGGDSGTGGVNPPPATGHAGGDGDGAAVAMFIGGQLSLSNCTLRDNRAARGKGGGGPFGGQGGGGQGGGFWVASESDIPASCTLSATTVASNVSAGGAGGHGSSQNAPAGAAVGGGGEIGSSVATTLMGGTFF